MAGARDKCRDALSPSPCCPFSFRVGISAALALRAAHLWQVE